MQRSLVLFVPCAAALAVPGAAQILFRSVNGPAAGAKFGGPCLRVPDQNGDLYADVVVGAPGFNSARGAIYCVSGAYLATGSGPQTLWSVQPTANPGDQFGAALTALGDLDGDGVGDFAVGEPGFDNGATTDIGAVCLISGATHLMLGQRYGNVAGGLLGSAVTDIGNSVGDARHDIAVGSGHLSASSVGVEVYNGVALFGFGAFGLDSGTSTIVSNPALSLSLAGHFDLDGDGYDEFVVGKPGVTTLAGANSGACEISIHTPNSYGSIFSYSSTIAGEQLGAAIDMSHDYDGDGVPDLLLGAPKSPATNNAESGRVVVLSGARCVAHTPPYELYTLSGADGVASPISQHFGAAVCGCDDLNGDGVADILVGAPDYFTLTPPGPGRGAVYIYSGASGARLSFLAGSSNDHLGASVGGALDDYDGDGFREFVAGGPLSDVNGADSGVVRAYKLFPVPPSTYCTAKTNSLGCAPTIAFSGTPSASSGLPFHITASNLINQKNGLLFYSHAPTAALFQGGIKCVHNPTVRTPTMSSGGSSSGSDCTGAYSFDFNDWIVNGWDATLAPGNEVYAQYWSRDPASASHTSLTNAIRFVINP